MMAEHTSEKRQPSAIAALRSSGVATEGAEPYEDNVVRGIPKLASGLTWKSAAMANVLQQALSQIGGGIATLISRFTDAGLGDHVQSWAVRSKPLPLDHIGRAFSQDEITNWSSQACRKWTT